MLKNLLLGAALTGVMASVSFELFPPRTPQAESQLWSALERLAPLDPSFISVTCGAGGSATDATLDAFQALEQIKGSDRLKTIPILAFANHEEVETWKRAKELGVTKIVSRNEFSSRTRDLVEELLSEQPTASS